MWKTLSIVAAILTAGAAFFSFKNIEQFKIERLLLDIATKNQAASTAYLQEARSVLAANVDGRKKTESDRDILVKQIDELKVKIDDLTKQVAERKTELEAATARWSEVKKSVDDLGGIEALKQQLASLSQEKSTLEGTVESFKQKTAIATERFNSLTKTITAMKTKEAWQAQGIIEDGFRSRVVQSDRTFGFVTINSGNASGVVSGATLDVIRGGNVIAQLKVTNVEQRYAVADVINGTLAAGTEVQVGDTVAVAKESSASAWRENQRRAQAAPAPAVPKAPGQAAPAAPAEGAPPVDPFAVDPAAPPPPADPAAPATPAAGAEGATPTPAAPPADPFAN